MGDVAVVKSEMQLNRDRPDSTVLTWRSWAFTGPYFGLRLAMIRPAKPF